MTYKSTWDFYERENVCFEEEYHHDLRHVTFYSLIHVYCIYKKGDKGIKGQERKEVNK